MQPQTAEEVASAIADVIEHPVAELYTNLASGPMARLYFEDVAHSRRAFTRALPRLTRDSDPAATATRPTISSQ